MRILLAAGAVFIFWLVLAMPLGLVDLAWGVPVSLLLGAWAVVYLWSGGGPGIGLRRFAGLVFYVFGLIYATVLAALQIARLVLAPSMPVHPVVVTYRTGLKTQLGRVALANTITLTPGTHCVDLNGDELTIHCLHQSFAWPILDGRVEARIVRGFGSGNAS